MSGDKEEINYWNKRLLDGPILLSGMQKHRRRELGIKVLMMEEFFSIFLG